MRKFLFLFASCIVIYSCSDYKSKIDKSSCHYKLDQLIISDSPQVLITFKNDTLTEVSDRGKDSTYGVYTFDRFDNLRFYAFFINQSDYKYSEEYDIKGNLIKSEGVPLVEYRLWRRNKDSIRFTFSLFSLNKKFENLEITTNRNDTIRPTHLYKSILHTNIKCFSFELPLNKNINELKFFTSGSFTNVCSNKIYFFTDTVSLKNIRM